MKIKILYLFSFLLLMSCSRRSLVYFNDLENQAYLENISNIDEPVIQPNDLLSISINSLSPEHNALFNGGVIQTGGRASAATASTLEDGYLVDKHGAVNLLVLGRVQLAGLTKEEATEKLTTILRDYVKEPVVNVKFLNFKVTVLGEVNNPSTFTLPTDKVSVLEVLGMAGDMTAFGKRENVLVIREKDGVRSTARLNLHSKNIFESPYFYLQQNDVVYVEPDKAKAAQASMSRSNISLGLSIATLLVLIASRLF